MARKIKKIIPLLIILLSGSLIVHPFLNGSSHREQIPEPDKTALNIIDQTINILSPKYDMHPIGFGMNGKFEHLSIEFQIFRPLKKDEARAMLFDCIEIFLNNINSNETIRPHLKDYPFTYKNVGIVFYIADKNHEDLFHPNISVAACTSFGISFDTKDPENIHRYKGRYKETHEEALELVKKQHIEGLSPVSKN